MKARKKRVKNTKAKQGNSKENEGQESWQQKAAQFFNLSSFLWEEKQ
jgi:hypothetical protein